MIAPSLQQFSLRTLLIGVTAICIVTVLGWSFSFLIVLTWLAVLIAASVAADSISTVLFYVAGEPTRSRRPTKSSMTASCSASATSRQTSMTDESRATPTAIQGNEDHLRRRAVQLLAEIHALRESSSD